MQTTRLHALLRCPSKLTDHLNAQARRLLLDDIQIAAVQASTYTTLGMISGCDGFAFRFATFHAAIIQTCKKDQFHISVVCLDAICYTTWLVACRWAKSSVLLYTHCSCVFYRILCCDVAWYFPVIFLWRLASNSNTKDRPAVVMLEVTQSFPLKIVNDSNIVDTYLKVATQNILQKALFRGAASKPQS